MPELEILSDSELLNRVNKTATDMSDDELLSSVNKTSFVTKDTVPSAWVKGEQSLGEKFAGRYPNPAEATDEISNTLLNSSIFKITPEQAIDHKEELTGVRKEAERFKAFRAGTRQSVVSLAGTAAGYKSAADKELNSFVPQYTSEELLYGFGQLVVDLPLMIAGGIIGTLGGGGNPITGAAGAFALPAGLRKVYIDKIQNGEVKDWNDFFNRLMGAVKETVKGEITGAATGAAGKFAPYGLKTLSEIGTMTTVGAALEGHVPSSKDFLHALVMVGGLKVSSRAGNYANKKFQEFYRDHNVKPTEAARMVDERLPNKDRSIAEVTEDLKTVFDDVEAEIKLLPAPKNMGEGFVFSDPKPQTILRKGENYTAGELPTDLEVIYKTEKGAKKAIKKQGLNETHEIAPVEGGFSIKEKLGLTKEAETDTLLPEKGGIDYDYFSNRFKEAGLDTKAIEHLRGRGEEILGDNGGRLFDSLEEQGVITKAQREQFQPEYIVWKELRTTKDISNIDKSGDIAGKSFTPELAEINTELTKINKAKEDIKEAKALMAKAPETAEFDSGVKTKADYQKYIDDTQGWIDNKAQEGKGEAEGRDISDILSDVNKMFGEKGAISGEALSLEQLAARLRLKKDYLKAQEEANKTNRVIGEVLKEKGFTEDTIDRLSKMFAEPKQISKPAMEDDVIKQRNLGTKKDPRYAPPVTTEDYAGLKTVQEIDLGPLNNKTVTSIFIFDKLGAWAKENFYRPMKVAEDSAKREYKKMEAEIITLRKPLPKKSADRIGIYAIAKQERGATKLEHMGIKEIPELTPEEMNAYNTMRGHYENLYNQIQVARAAAGKETFDSVSDYFTFVHQMTFLESLGFSPVLGNKALLQNAIFDNISQFVHRKATPFGFAKHRTNALYDLNTNAFDVFLKYSDTATRHIAKSPVIAKGREMLLKMPDGETLMERAPNSAKWLTEWLDFQAGQKPGTQLPPLIDRGLQALNKNMAFAVLSANLRSAFIVQPTSLVNSVTAIGLGNVKSGLAQIFNPKRVKFAQDNSKVLLTREFDINIVEALKANGLLGGVIKGYSKGRQYLGEKGMFFIQWMDMKMAQATWLGAYEKAIKDGFTEKNAFKYADDLVTRTQASAVPSDIAPIQRTTLGKTLTIFQTFVINDWNFLLKDVAGINNPNISKTEAMKNILTWTAGATLFNILYEDIIGVNSPFPTPLNAAYNALDRGDNLFSVSKEIALELAQLAPFLGGTRYGSSPFGATVDFIQDVSEKVGGKPMAKSAPELIGKGLGIPYTVQMKRILEAETLKEAAIGKQPKF